MKEELVVPQDTTTTMSAEEWFDISRRMENHHSVFYMLWQMGKPVFTNTISTAAIGFMQGQAMEFLINPQFWATRTPTQREFLLAHEMLHVILNHGERIRDTIKGNESAANAALDVVVNHTLVDYFNFKREEIDPKNQFCWRDTVFNKTVKADQTFEYYFNKLEKCECPSLVLVDDHSGLANTGSLSDIDIEKISETLSDEEMRQLKDALEKHTENKKDNDSQQAGTDAGGFWKRMSDAGIKKKRKWETVIRHWADPFMPKEDRTIEHWLRTNRRLFLVPDAALLPSEMEEDDKPDLGKISVLLLLDTSGSCAHLANRFWKAGRSLPSSRFDVTMACFDTKVYPVNMDEKKLYGFGGTSFSVLEDYVRTLKTYPRAIFVITDGYGDRINPIMPERWYWFLTTSCKYYIPKSSRIFSLSDYE